MKTAITTPPAAESALPHPDGKKPAYAFDTPCYTPHAKSPGEGWRFLEHGERIEYGDMTSSGGSFEKPEWIPCEASVDRIVADTQKFRRRVSTGSLPLLDIRFDHRHNRADIYSGNLLIGEMYTGGKNQSTSERLAWKKIETAVNAHAAAQQRIALLEWAIDNRANVVRITGTDEWELYFPGNGLPTAQGISRDDVIIKAQARLALRHPSPEAK